jgi:1,4-dihydroxy-2-naphthoate octaprenyltransferase
VGSVVGLVLVRLAGWPILLLGLVGVPLAYAYTGPPLKLAYRGLGELVIFLLMGPLMVAGTQFVVSGSFDLASLVVSLPVGLLVTAILHGNEWRDIGDDARAGIRTFSVAAGRRAAHVWYVGLVAGAYVALGLGVAAGVLPPASLLAMLSMPLLVRAIRSSELGAEGHARAIARIDLETAQLHAVFGVLFAVGLALAALVR